MTEKNRAPRQKTASPSDLLSMERTKLSNDRTLLAYIRTSITFFAAAAALIELFHKSIKFKVTAYVSIALGVILLTVGFYNYYRAKKFIKALRLDQ